jgi:tocopherol cyclase
MEGGSHSVGQGGARHMLDGIRATLDPARYHGAAKKRPFFEGWYFKVIDRSENHRYAIIPGVFRGRDQSMDHAFIQVLDGTSGRAAYNEYPLEAFASASDRFDIAVGENRFSQNSIALSIDRPDCSVQGNLRFVHTVPWPVSLFAPGIMGWYAWVPFMQCYHGVLSLDHAIEGSLAISGEIVDFAGGRGYTEKDWGRSFPAAWVWCQSNHFEQQGTSLTASVAIIPWVRGSFPGFIIGLWHERKLYRFATYTGARIDTLTIEEQAIHWVVRDRRYRLEMLLSRAGGSLIVAPSEVGMDRRIAETLNASVEVHLSTGGRTVFRGIGRHAGLEAAGDIDRLMRLHQARRPQPS